MKQRRLRQVGFSNLKRKRMSMKNTIMTMTVDADIIMKNIIMTMNADVGITMNMNTMNIEKCQQIKT